MLTFFIRGTGLGTYDGIAGNDTLDGGAGLDTLYGDGGDDILIGGAGADKLYGGAGDDTASYVGATAGVTVNLGGTKYNESGAVDSDAAKNIFIKGVGGDAADDLLNSIEHLTGGAGNDTLTGNDGNNTLTGGAGNDTLSGGAGADTLTGGAGGDTLTGGGGVDTASYAGSNAGVTVNLATNSAAGGHAAGDTLSGIENLIGSDHADTLTGDSGNNTLTGGAGKDTLTGGGGNDVFGVADSATSAALADLITDFTSGDKLDVGSLTHIWFDNGDAVTGVGTSTNDTVIYAGNADNSAADTSKVLAVLQDFTTDLTGTDFNGTITVAEIA
ncbi:MAG: calcium-binding protein [Candidatus Puniceispirillaceae bacterium]